MKKSILLLGAIFMTAIAYANNSKYYIMPEPPADSNGSGTSWANAITIDQLNEKIKSTAHGDRVFLKSGIYKPTERIGVGYNITFKGGLAGIDDVTLDPNEEKSILDGQNNLTAIFSVYSGGLITFENIEMRNAYCRGVDKSTDAEGSIIFKKCIFDSCGRNWKSDYTANDGFSSLRGAVGRFKGVSTATLSFEDCVFSRNTYEEPSNQSLGMGIAIACMGWKRVTFDGCLFVSNGVGRASLKLTGGTLRNTRGAAIYSECPLTIRNTEFRANRTGINAALGGIVYIRNAGANSTFTNCLFLANSCEHINTDSSSKEGGIIAFRSKTSDVLDVVNCTFAYNFTASANNVSAGIDVGSSNSRANIRNSIFYGAQKTASLKCGKDICVSSGCTANIDYCLFEENSTACISGTGTINKGSNNVFGDPKFARAITADEVASIMVNNGSYYGYAADAYETVFSKADVHALNRRLTVDTGDPASPFANEPHPNGKRVNLGYYGNTPEALSTLSGMKIIIR